MTSGPSNHDHVEAARQYRTVAGKLAARYEEFLEEAAAAGGHVRAALDLALREARECVEICDRIIGNPGEAGLSSLAGYVGELLSNSVKQIAFVLDFIGRDHNLQAPDLPGARTVEPVTERTTWQAPDGSEIVVSPDFTPENPYRYDGGRTLNVSAPRGFYSHPWWFDVTVGAAAGTAVLTVGAMFLAFAHRAGVRSGDSGWLDYFDGG
ncbi:hypothetical protein [Saccharothrix xinjiangensis]|uniref:Uncharacterized protein n=1 Tax=Saccharothrix xinjiangensis TaxID=204798 RepID=A0ABV9XWN3_9PSEU